MHTYLPPRCRFAGPSTTVGIASQDATLCRGLSARRAGGSPSVQGFHDGCGVGRVDRGRLGVSPAGDSAGGAQGGRLPEAAHRCAQHSQSQKGMIKYRAAIIHARCVYRFPFADRYASRFSGYKLYRNQSFSGLWAYRFFSCAKHRIYFPLPHVRMPPFEGKRCTTYMLRTDLDTGGGWVRLVTHGI